MRKYRFNYYLIVASFVFKYIITTKGHFIFIFFIFHKLPFLLSLSV